MVGRVDRIALASKLATISSFALAVNACETSAEALVVVLVSADGEKYLLERVAQPIFLGFVCGDHLNDQTDSIDVWYVACCHVLTEVRSNGDVHGQDC